MNKYVIYTALTGGYDKVLQPQVIDERFDYILFTDNIRQSQIGVWQVRSIDYTHADSTRVSRYPKLLPHKVLAEYEASLYIDGNVQIASSLIYERFIELMQSDYEWAEINHPWRDCIYDEAYLIMGSLERESVVLQWCHRLYKEGFPRHWGLYENNIIFRKHTKTTQAIDELWWHLYENHARRDQLTLMYLLWKHPELKRTSLMQCREDSFIVNKHHSSKTRSVHETFWQHARTRCRSGLEEKTEAFREFHYRLYKYPIWFEKIILFFWGVWNTALYGKEIKRRAAIRHQQKGDF